MSRLAWHRRPGHPGRLHDHDGEHDAPCPTDLEMLRLNNPAAYRIRMMSLDELRAEVERLRKEVEGG